MKQLSGEHHKHVLVNRVLDVPVPVRLNGASAAIGTYVTPESAACNYLSEPIYVCTIRKCGCHLRCMNDLTIACASCMSTLPEDIDPRIQEEMHQKPCWDLTH